ncbi:protein adenylyltransferase SelO [Frigidibacter sp. ROC022]|uniref:protein adenylyltransferase SelO n=1 Tax=Frigidibacter sp. ROC022 TaxID=2971796 RepID=UPI00215AE087|nr:YdiU family protein [Frigidibacter sp. ROC022]MCR8723690.1 YdiU family protein [Frigidibacter sp. ROC022]
MTLSIAFDNSYARLPDRFFARQAPVPVAAPQLLAVNAGLADELGLDPQALASREGLEVLAGNRVAEGSEPLAQAYAGHQFGGWVPRLGDGRAVLLGEVIDRQGRRRDLQLKGAGRTPFSRGGDGRAWLGPVLREYVVSEAMHALGLPTTRALAAVGTGEMVQRETALPGAVLTRVAASHIRVGTFQYLVARNDIEGLSALTEHVIARHYPQAEGPMGLLQAVVAAQAQLIAGWMSVGFIHGVMNTDNMSVAGETIDYGPCAFMDGYDPGKVFSSIDLQGRYAYANQPQIAVWNLAQLASSLLPLMGGESAIPAATEEIERFADLYSAAWAQRFAAKLGFSGPPKPGDCGLAQRLLDQMARAGADFTNTFRALAEGRPTGLEDGKDYAAWQADWQARLADEPDPQAVMRAANPAVIPRNHQVERMIEAAVAGDMAPFERLTAALEQPFADSAPAWLREAPGPDEEVTRTFCGT